MAEHGEKRAKLTRKSAIESFCWDCMGRWSDGKIDCQNPHCTLYNYQPYRKQDPDLWWTEYNPRRPGFVKYSDIKPQTHGFQKRQTK